jgi:hypothetical protein
MPKASEHIARSVHKYLLIGDSGTGKTTALAPLVGAGYKLRICDFDNLLDPLLMRVRKEHPDKLDNIEFMSFRDRLKATDLGSIIEGTPKAFSNFLKAMAVWEDGSKPHEWGSEYVVVVDSLTTMAKAAYFWARGINNISGLPEGVAHKGVDGRHIYHTAQRAVMNAIDALTADHFNANVIVIAHVKYLEQDGVTKGFPLSVGTAIGPEIPTYFPAVVLATKDTTGRRVFRTRSTNMIDLKDPKAFDPAFASEIPMDKGLLDLFK